MSKLTKALPIVALVIVVVGVGIVVGWLGSRAASPSKQPGDPSGGSADGSQYHPILNKERRPGTTNIAVAALASNPAAAGGANARPAVAPPNLITNWEDKLDEILASEGDETNKVDELFAMFPNLDQEAQVEVAQHLANLVPDENYAPLAQLLENAQLPEDVLDVLMADLLNRPNSSKLPVLLNVARNANHSNASEARDLLELFLDEDYGTDWPKWQEKIAEWLKENPD